MDEAEAEASTLWPVDANSWLTEKNPDAGKDGGQEEKQGQRMRWLHGITSSMDSNSGKLRGTVRDREPGGLESMGKESDTALATEWQQTPPRVSLTCADT